MGSEIVIEPISFWLMAVGLSCFFGGTFFTVISFLFNLKFATWFWWIAMIGLIAFVCSLFIKSFLGVKKKNV